MIDLGTLGGLNSHAYGINNNGYVVGRSQFRSNNAAYHAFLYDGANMTDLGTLGGTNSHAEAINDLNQVVGCSLIFGSSDWHAFIYESGNLLDLNTLIPSDSGWVLERAYDINNSGQIVGFGSINGQTRAFLMTPVPEPTTLSLLFIGSLALLRNRN